VAADALRSSVRSTFRSQVRDQLRFVLPVVGGAALLLVWLVAVEKARFDGATTALVFAGVVLVACLRSLYRLVNALARPDLQIVIDQAGDVGLASDRELREERRRLLRALNELRFDHEMGKLSQADYDKVREGYELRAIEVMRKLEAHGGLHPELAKRLGKPDAAAAEPGAVEPAPSEVPTDRMEVPREPNGPAVDRPPAKAPEKKAETP
jgi:hypothetical protein